MAQNNANVEIGSGNSGSLVHNITCNDDNNLVAWNMTREQVKSDLEHVQDEIDELVAREDLNDQDKQQLNRLKQQEAILKERLRQRDATVVENKRTELEQL